MGLNFSGIGWRSLLDWDGMAWHGWRFDWYWAMPVRLRTRTSCIALHRFGVCFEINIVFTMLVIIEKMKFCR